MKQNQITIKAGAEKLRESRKKIKFFNMEKVDSKKLQEIFEQIKQANNGENINIIPLSDLVYVVYDKVNNRFYLFNFDKIGIINNPDSVNLEIFDMRTSEYKWYSVPIDDYEKIADGQARINFAEKCVAIFRDDTNKENLDDSTKGFIS